MLLFTAAEVEGASLSAGINPGVAGLLGGMTGGIAQAYATMGMSKLVDALLHNYLLLGFLQVSQLV